MDIERYFAQRKQRESAIEPKRVLCLSCFQPQKTCYCHVIEKFDPLIKFVILIHPLEAKRRIASGRMSHLSLTNSLLLEGEDYSQDKALNLLLQQDLYSPLVLYPSAEATNLSHCTPHEMGLKFTREKPLLVIVIDGTWNTARKMIRLSRNISHLERICFSPHQPSRFRVRKQPTSNCYSTLEAIHHTIELLGPSQGFDVKARTHDGLLRTFDFMVEQQLEFIRTSQASHSRHRRW